ncbi:VOC family protein [Ekhidna sp.]|uniref:VOC family protein n=1 Tax=Ekhidna sp. TaxID=2608089 RepID=UPI00329723AF
MATINIYLTFNGNCEDAFTFYKSVFGGDFAFMGRFGEMPSEAGGDTIPEDQKERIMHVSLPISKETVLMGSDTGGEWAAKFKEGNNFSISVTADSKDHADRIFGELSSGGKVTMPLSDTFWGDYFGSCADKFGINWMVSFKDPNQSY